MSRETRNTILVIIALWLIQVFLEVGPLRSKLEIMLVLSLVPGLDLLIEVFELLSKSNVGSLVFYVKLFIIFIKDALIADLLGIFDDL